MLFNVFINDLHIDYNGLSHTIMYVDDTTIQVKIYQNSNEQTCKETVDLYFVWPKSNDMPCNISGCKELVLNKKNRVVINPVNGIKQVEKLKILGVTFQDNNRFNEHVKEKLIEANKCFYVLMTMCNEGHIQSEIDFFILYISLT